VDLATLSLIATVVGSFVVWAVGPVVGIVLGYRALRDARDGGGGRDVERLPKIAVAVGWGVLAVNMLFPCVAVGVSGVQAGCSMFEELLDAVLSVFSG